ncbi:MAG: hypothetical protein JWL81_121 [Verrucomicrobiales bacterium]|nr:hypothetical protein [Verrucomicrobiales bacterium]
MKELTAEENQMRNIGAIFQFSGLILMAALNALRMSGHLTWLDMTYFFLIFCLFFLCIAGVRRTHKRIAALEFQLAELRKSLQNTSAP